MKSNIHVINIVTGDYSGDGHKQHKETVIRTNFSREEIETAFKRGSEKLGFDITSMCESYEDNIIDIDVYEKLVSRGFKHSDLDIEFNFALRCNDETIPLDSKRFTEIYLFIVKLGDDSFEFSFQEFETIEIGGYGLFLD
jgi:hypothetical protein